MCRQCAAPASEGPQPVPPRLRKRDMPDAAETTTDNTLGFAPLLQQELDRPGILSEAYRAFHRDSLGNQLLAAGPSVPIARAAWAGRAPHLDSAW